MQQWRLSRDQPHLVNETNNSKKKLFWKETWRDDVLDYCWLVWCLQNHVHALHSWWYRSFRKVDFVNSTSRDESWTLEFFQRSNKPNVHFLFSDFWKKVCKPVYSFCKIIKIALVLKWFSLSFFVIFFFSFINIKVMIGYSWFDLDHMTQIFCRIIEHIESFNLIENLNFVKLFIKHFCK